MRYYFGYAVDMVNFFNPFGKITESLTVIYFLKSFPAFHPATDLSHEHDHRRTVLLGDMDTRSGIGCARTSSDHTDPRSSSHFSIRFGHHGRAAFLTGNYCLNGTAMKTIQNSEIAFARYTENTINALRFKTFYD